jgi:uncharacterized membrane protein
MSIIFKHLFTLISTERAITIGKLLPPPDDMKKYNDLIPEGGERIFKMVEDQFYHKIKMDRIKTYIVSILIILFTIAAVVSFLTPDHTFSNIVESIPLISHIF